MAICILATERSRQESQQVHKLSITINYFVVNFRIQIILFFYALVIEKVTVKLHSDRIKKYIFFKYHVHFIFILIICCVYFTENIQMNKLWKSMHKCIRLWIYSAYVGVTTQNEDYLVLRSAAALSSFYWKGYAVARLNWRNDFISGFHI